MSGIENIKSLQDVMRIGREYFDKRRIYETFLEGIEALSKEIKELKVDNKKLSKKKIKEPLSVTIGLFDLHIGEKIIYTDPETNESSVIYDHEIASKLLEDVFNQAYKVIDPIIDNVCEINIVLGGDIVEGDAGIYPTQVYNMSTSILDQLKTASVEITKHILNTSTKYPDKKIRIYGIGGNHGEIRGGMPRKLRDNYDIILAKYVDVALRIHNEYNKHLDNVQVIISESSLSAYIKTCQGYIIEVIHELRKNLGTPKSENILLSRKAGWDVDLILTGHFHSPTFHQYGDVKVLRSGSLAGPNEYSKGLGIAPGGRHQFIVISSPEDVAYQIVNIIPKIREE